MSSSRPKPSEEQWLSHQALIRRLYIVEDVPLEKLVDQLRGQGLDVTSSQLEYKLKKWNFRKNISKETWVEIDHCISKRKREGKHSEVILCGKRVKPETVNKETDRHRDMSVFARFIPQQPSSPMIPANTQVSVCTPQSVSMEFEWPGTLPWLQLPVSDLRIMLDTNLGTALNNKKIQLEAVIPTVIKDGNRLTTNAAQFGVSKLAAIIRVLLPESYSEEHLQRAQRLLSGSQGDHLLECLLIVIYSVSNNMYYIFEGERWQAIMTILKACGIFEIGANLKNLKSATIDGFMESLFVAALEKLQFGNNSFRPENNSVGYEDGITILKWLIDLGQSPIMPGTWFWRNEFGWQPSGSTSKQWSHLDLVEHFLEAGADANHIPLDEDNTNPRMTILGLVLVSDRSHDEVFRMAKLLLEHGASIDLDVALHSAIMNGMNRKLIEIILQRGGNLTAELPCPYGVGYKLNALGVAVITGLSGTRYILDLMAFHYPSKPIAEFITTDVLVSVAASGECDSMRFLHSKSGVAVANEYGVTPLHAAAKSSGPDMCELLLPLYNAYISDVTPIFSPLHLACYGSCQSVVRFLISKGADVNAIAKIGLTDQDPWRLRLGPGNYKKPLDLVFDGPWGGIPGEALPCASILISAGADLTGREVEFAARGLDPELLLLALDRGADPNGGSGTGLSPLGRALSAGKDPAYLQRLYKTVKLLLENGARPLGEEITAAIRSNNRDIVELLLRYGASLLGGEVTHAIQLKNRPVVDLLLGYGASLMGGEVTTAIRLEDWDTVDLLLRYGASLLDADEHGTALEAAIESQAPLSRLSRLFVAAPDIYDAGSLCAAMETRQDLIIQQLLTNRRTNPVAHDLEVTAIAIAAESGNIDLLRRLLEHPLSCKSGPMPLGESGRWLPEYPFFPRLQYCSTERGDYLRGSPLALIAGQRGEKAIEVCSELLKNGFQPDWLTWAVASDSNNLAFVQFLTDHGQRFKGDSRHEYGRSNALNPLLGAVKHHNRELAALLLGVGVDVNEHGETKTSDRRSPLQLAAEMGDLGMVHYLIEAGADVNAPPTSDYGATPLRWAVMDGYIGIAKHLIDHGADVNAPRAPGERVTVLEEAAESGHIDMLALLLAAGARKTGDQHRSYVRAVKRAIHEHHHVAANLLKQSLGWSKEDEELFGTEDIDN